MLSSFPAYFLSFFPLEAGGANRMESSNGVFFGAGLETNLNFTWLIGILVGLVCYGGLGIKKLLPHNLALLGKWLQCYTLEDTTL